MKKRVSVHVLAALLGLLTVILIGTVIYHEIEDWDYIQSFYFSVSTITTVGYGDLTPTSDASRLFTAVYMLIGVATALAALGAIGNDLLKKREERLLNRMINGKKKTKKK